jgi:hypothetical protein
MDALSFGLPLGFVVTALLWQVMALCIGSTGLIILGAVVVVVLGSLLIGEARHKTVLA